LWRLEAIHPDWTEEEGGEDGWEPLVASWAVRTDRGLVLIDPLVDDWAALDELVGQHGLCPAILRTVHYHQRSIAQVSERYGADVWAMPAPEGVPQHPYDRPVRDGTEVIEGIRATVMERDDEVAYWLPRQRALVFGDAMLRRAGGELRVCPDWWVQPAGGSARLRQILRGLAAGPVEHVLVSHGPLVLGDGPQALASALG